MSEPNRSTDSQALLTFVLGAPSRVESMLADPETFAARHGFDPAVVRAMAGTQAHGLRVMATIVRTKWLGRCRLMLPATFEVLAGHHLAEGVVDRFFRAPLPPPYAPHELGERFADHLRAAPEFAGGLVPELARLELLLYRLATAASRPAAQVDSFAVAVVELRARVLAGLGATAEAGGDAAPVPHAFRRDVYGHVRIWRLSPPVASVLTAPTATGLPPAVVEQVQTWLRTHDLVS